MYPVAVRSTMQNKISEGILWSMLHQSSRCATTARSHFLSRNTWSSTSTLTPERSHSNAISQGASRHSPNRANSRSIDRSIRRLQLIEESRRKLARRTTHQITPLSPEPKRPKKERMSNLLPSQAIPPEPPMDLWRNSLILPSPPCFQTAIFIIIIAELELHKILNWL